MNIFDLVADQPNIVIDKRASKYDNHPPGFVRSQLCETIEKAWMLLDSSSVRPVAIVKQDGSVLITSAGGSGQIWVIGESANGKQQAMVDLLSELLIRLGGIAVHSDSDQFI